MTREKFVPKSLYLNYMKKAQEFYEQSNDAFEKEHWNSCVSNAVHTAISIVDAITVQQLGRKSNAQNHMEAYFLLNDVKTSDENRKSNLKHDFADLISLKTPAEYGETLMSKADAERATNKCKKIYSFIYEEIKKNEI